jgi:two-component system, LytTR family, sensor kinase
MSSDARHYLPLSAWPAGLWRALVIVWALFWVLMILVAVQDNWDDDAIRWWQPVVWEGSSALVGTSLMLLLFRYGERQRHLLASPARWFWQHLKWLPLASTLFIICAYGLRYAFYALLGTQYSHDPWWQLWPYETIKLGLFMSLWLGVIFGVHSFLAWREQQDRLHVMQRALTEAKLQQLKAQLQPHFLFNTLNTISSFMHSDVERADKLLTQLADLLRVSLTLGERDLVPLADELHLLRLYAGIMTERFTPRVQLEWRIADDCLHWPVPTLLLQPLLENAFKHGVERATGTTRIVIAAQRVSAGLQLHIQNHSDVADGLKAAAAPATTGIGLRNCRERLHGLYGEQAVLSVQPQSSGYAVTITLPAARP